MNTWTCIVYCDRSDSGSDVFHKHNVITPISTVLRARTCTGYITMRSCKDKQQ